MSNPLAFLLHILSLNSILCFENFVGYKTNPILESDDKYSMFSFGRAKAMDEHPDSIMMGIQPGNGPKMTVPRGIFHYSDRERDFGSDFKVPNMGRPIDFNGRMKTKDNSVGVIFRFFQTLLCR